VCIINSPKKGNLTPYIAENNDIEYGKTKRGSTPQKGA
jgi:hypothetical protein